MSNLFFDIENHNNYGAEFSTCRKYRYSLWRIWNDNLPLIMFIGLNPSTANEEVSDRTIETVVRYAKNWCYGGVYMMNLFTYVTRNPDQLIKDDAFKDNIERLKKVGDKCQDIIFAWGAFKAAKERAATVIKMFPNARALAVNKDGTPHHPLYLPGNIRPVKYFIIS